VAPRRVDLRPYRIGLDTGEALELLSAFGQQAGSLHGVVGGRDLPFWYGKLGQEMVQIARLCRAACESLGVACDIEWASDKRIYGDGWYKFLGGCRAVLGTESGSNLFDFDGSAQRDVKRYLRTHPDAPFEEVHAACLAGKDDFVAMNQVSPKIFESILMGTALVLFEGDYSGVVRAHDHYLPLDKDLGNFEQVVEAVRDTERLSEMTARAKRDVLESGRYGYSAFIEDFDHRMDCGLRRGIRTQIPETPGTIWDRLPGWTINALGLIPASIAGPLRRWLYLFWRNVLRAAIVRTAQATLPVSARRKIREMMGMTG